ncbi:MAG: glycosyltransferase family 39 protein [Chloroflexota bacterium]
MRRKAPAALPLAAASAPATPAPSPFAPHLLRSVLAFLTLLAATIGQLRLSSNPEMPASGLRWFLFSGITLFLLVGQWRGLRLPNLPRPHLKEMPQQRWLYLLALFLAFLGQGLVNNLSGVQRPFLAIIIWMSAIILAFYALKDKSLPSSVSTQSLSLPTAALIFFAALLPRAINLTTLPFILNGTEASLGLDVLQIAQGSLRHPFATGWMTNPTLPLFIMALPLKLLGPSTLSLRLLSPLVGAVTVTLTYWFGRRLWNEIVGLVGAILLGGMHLHLHYSRMGLTNVWEPLLTLLALGLLALAWQETDTAQQRKRWLWAGTAVGLSAYWFTTSHLLPLMLVGLLLWALLVDRATLWQQGRHILAAAMLALLIALPLLLFYNSHPQYFMERANALGIFAGQSNWLAQEAANTGMSQGALLRQQLWQGILAFNGNIDKSPSYRPLAALLSFGPALFFTIGLLLAVLTLRQLRYALLLIWVVVTLLFAGAFLQEPPQSHRLLIAAPAVALLAALALTTLGQVFWVRLTELGTETAVSRHLLTFVLVIAALLAVNDLVFYFGRFPEQNSFADRNTEIAQRMADYLNTLDESWTAYFYGPPNMYVSFPTIPLLAADFQANVNLFDVPPAPDNTVPLPTTTNQVFIYLPERQTELLETQAALPGGDIRSFPGVYADPLFFVYEIRP